MEAHGHRGSRPVGGLVARMRAAPTRAVGSRTATLAAVVLAALGSGGPAASGAVFGPAQAEANAPASYKGSWFGTTATGEEISFTVNKKNQITVIRFAYEIEGDDCSSRVDDRARGPLQIRNKAFTLAVQSKQETVRLKGRFASKTRVAGTLAATFTDENGCTGSMTTTWNARKGQRPVAGVYDGTWNGPVVLPPGLDAAIVALADLTIEFTIQNGKVTSMSAPWVVQGTGCQSALVGRIVKSLDPPVALAGSQLDASFSSAAAGAKTWDVHGTFASPTAASGTLAMAGSSGTFAGACAGSLEATWTATKAPG